MSGVAIVAVPNKSNPVWAVSSEKIPHMTLLYLGDALAEEDYRKVQEFVTHVADTTLHRFGMSVDKRGTLGDDDADVLFFRNEENSAISLFRAYLLQDTTIREAYEKTEQFDGWTPHLTLGYPDSPAKKDPREVSEFYYIGFDKLMIWTDEFAGPEIELNDLGAAVAMSGLADATQNFLAHYGVMGMRWGLRRNRVELSDASAARLAKVHETGSSVVDGKSVTKTKLRNPEKRKEKKDEWRAAVTDKKTVDKVVAKALPRINEDLASLKATTKGRTMTALQRNNYQRQAQDIINAHLDTAATSVSGLSPGRNPITLRAAMTITDGKLKMRVKPTARAQNWQDMASRRRASEEVGDFGEMGQSALSGKIPDEGLLYNVLTDDGGYIIGFEVVSETLGLAQSDLDKGTSFLEHYGVKGMQWGVRRSREERRADRTAKVQAAAEKKVAKAEQYTARANAKASVAKARTATADAKAAAANARLETKLAEKQAKFAKAEARSGKDDPANGLIRDTSGLVGSSNRESAKLRDNAIKDLRTLDDQTLKAYSERINTEKKLKETIKQDQAPGRTATKKLIADAGKDVAKTALVGAGSMAVFYLLGRVGASRGQNPKPKINWEGAANTTTNSKSKAKDAFDFAKEAADAARTTSVPKNKYPGAIPTTGRALPTTGSSAPPGYKRKPGFDPDNWTLRPGKEP